MFMCNVFAFSIHLLFVLPSGWSDGSGMEDGRPQIPQNLLGKAGNPPSDPPVPAEKKYAELARNKHDDKLQHVHRVCHGFHI